MRQTPILTRLTGARLDAPRWYILRVMGGQESAKRDRLNLAGVHVAYPTRERVWRDAQGRTQCADVPQVAGYIFAKFSHAPSWTELRRQRVIIGVVTKPSEWGPVPYVASEDDVRTFLGMPTVAEDLEAQRREALRVHPGDRALVLLGDDVSLAVNVVKVLDGVIHWETSEGFKGQSRPGNTEKMAAE